ncbi:MAG: zf-HC2 domain-containing protein [Acidobacteria bacterium]|nr:zf-HC2 domain-containing protein [Acidobacteriota bacterium]
MSCDELELLLCDYIDGTLPAAERVAFEAHLASCPACREFAQDASAAVSFMERAAEVEPPPSLVTRILQQAPDRQPVTVKAKSAFGQWVGSLFEPILRPRLVMGMAMTILSFAMLGRFAGIEARQLRAADLHPVKVWESAEDRMHRSWNRAVKYYESLRIVYEVQSMLRDLSSDEDDAAQQPDNGTAQPSRPAAPGAENTGAQKK